VSDFANYMLKQAESRAAFADYNRAARSLDLARIHERLAEIKSQHHPLESLANARLTDRERLYAAAFYVVVGRMPEHGAMDTKVRP
jgi:hypothetical protein